MKQGGCIFGNTIRGLCLLGYANKTWKNINYSNNSVLCSMTGQGFIGPADLHFGFNDVSGFGL